MITTAKIAGYDGKQLILLPADDIDRELLRKQVDSVEIRLVDGREITSEQRRKIFATIRDISIWSGHEPEHIRTFLTWQFCCEYRYDDFSLSTVERSIATEFITYLIDFCFYHDIPTKDTLLNQTDDIGKYLYLCLEHRKCAICNRKAEVHHINRIGMGRDREQIVHVGLNAIALCRDHHDQAHLNEKELFSNYHVYGIKLDRYLCDRLNLNAKKGI